MQYPVKRLVRVTLDNKYVVNYSSCYYFGSWIFACSGEQSRELHKMKNKPTDCHISRVHNTQNIWRYKMWCGVVWCGVVLLLCMAFNILFCSVSLIIPILLAFFNCHVCVHNFALAFCFARQSHILWALCFPLSSFRAPSVRSSFFKLEFFCSETHEVI